MRRPCTLAVLRASQGAHSVQLGTYGEPRATEPRPRVRDHTVSGAAHAVLCGFGTPDRKAYAMVAEDERRQWRARLTRPPTRPARRRHTRRRPPRPPAPA